MKKLYLQILLFFIGLVTTVAQVPNYNVVSIPYQNVVLSPSIFSNTISFNYDDTYSDSIGLPFFLKFYGNTYSTFSVSSNGYIAFNSNNPGSSSPWSFNTTIPNAGFPVKNAFLGCYHDIDNSIVNTTDPQSVVYSIQGYPPFRKVIVLYSNTPQFSCNNSAISTFAMIMYEDGEKFDVQIKRKDLCATWNGGRAVVGLIDPTGTSAIAAPGRNTSAWTANYEAWRFYNALGANHYKFWKCETDGGGIEPFNLAVVKTDLNEPSMTFYAGIINGQVDVNTALPEMYQNTTAFNQTVYGLKSTGEIVTIDLKVFSCNYDYDLDNVTTPLEDLNNDTNLANDDTDADGTPNFIDNDDDGDLILTSIEYVFNSNKNTNSTSTTNSVLDTDNDGIPNYLDNDDDGDGVLTMNEDYNGNRNPADDDTNGNSIPDYLETSVALGTAQNILDSYFTVYPNPANDVLFIKNNNFNNADIKVKIVSVTGAVVKEMSAQNEITPISVAALQSGMYIVEAISSEGTSYHKFIKK